MPHLGGVIAEGELAIQVPMKAATRKDSVAVHHGQSLGLGEAQWPKDGGHC
jgi:hypothetical protein